MESEISQLLLLAIFCVVAIVLADWAMRPKDRDDDDLCRMELFGPGLVYTSIKARKIYGILEDHGKNRFANGQRRRDLRAINQSTEAF